MKRELLEGENEKRAGRQDIWFYVAEGRVSGGGIRRSRERDSGEGRRNKEIRGRRFRGGRGSGGGRREEGEAEEEEGNRWVGHCLGLLEYRKEGKREMGGERRLKT